MPVRARGGLMALSDIHFSGKAAFKTVREQRDALSLIRRLAASADMGIAGLRPSGAILHPLSGGRSAARVFRLTPLFGPEQRIKGPPVVLKLAPRAQGAQEQANYTGLVRWGLPPALRPELLGFAQTRAFAGLCYAFAGPADGSGADTLTRRLQRGDGAGLDRVLRAISDPMRETWYSPALSNRETDLAHWYLQRHFSKPHSEAEAEAALQACAARYFKARPLDGRYAIGGLSFPSPCTALFAAHAKRPYRSCVLHGDLNSDNVILTDGPAGVALIDFLKTGRGHVYEDLVAIEASVRINHPRDASFADILQKERLIALGRRQPASDPYCTAIREVRAATRRCFGRSEDASNYHFAVAAVGLRLMRATDLSHAARARITASTLWAAKAVAGEKL